MRPAVGVAASVLVASLVDGPRRQLRVVAGSRLAWQLADPSGRVVASLVFPGGVRLPASILLPAPTSLGLSPRSAASPPAQVVVGDHLLHVNGRAVRVTRWWRPARPRLPWLRDRVAPGAVVSLAGQVPTLVGLGDGLTPYHDDVLCGAMVAAHAAEAPVGPLADAVRRVDLETRTTATSASLLRQAADGYCVDEVAGYLTALARRDRVAESRAQLLALGHSSGAGLLEGIHRILTERESEAAA